jgi:hypothetical protein
MRLQKSWLIVGLVVLLAACATQQTRSLDCECGLVRLECTYGEATYVIPSATCPSDLSQPVSTCISVAGEGNVCTTETPPNLTGTADDAADEEAGLTCTFSPQPAPEGYEGDEAELYCWGCSDGEMGCSQAYQEAYGSNSPVR